MPRRTLGWLAVLVVPAIVVAGFTGAVVANAENVSQVRAAQSDYSDAWDDAVTAHERAESSARDAAALAIRADQLIYIATTFEGLAHLNPESLAALNPLVTALESALAVEVPVSSAPPAWLDIGSAADYADATLQLRAWAETLDAEWSAVPASTVPATLERLEGALRTVALGVAADGAAVLARSPGAAATARSALADAIEAVATSIDSGGSSFGAVTSYALAAQAVVDSQIAADVAAAAAAAAAQSSSGGGSRSPFPTLTCEQMQDQLPPPIINGVQMPDIDDGLCYVQNPDGTLTQIP